jgi:hypothetical protein
LIEEYGWSPKVQPYDTYWQSQLIDTSESFLLFGEEDGLENSEYQLIDIELEAHERLISILDITEPCVQIGTSIGTIC